VVVVVFAKHAPLGSFCVSALDRVCKIVEVRASLFDEFKSCGLSMTGMNRCHAIFSELFELVQAQKPTIEMFLLQIEMRLVVDQVRG